MDIHENAHTTRHRRMLMVQRLASGWTPAAVAQAQGVTARTVRKWRDRFVATGEVGLANRSSRPHRSPTRLGGPAEQEIEALRRQRMTGPAIARRLGRPLSIVGVVLRRRGLGRLRALDPRPAIIRYERERPGELLHIDIKKLGRIDGVGHRITGERTGQSTRRSAGRGLGWAGLGWEFVHVADDDASRLAYTELMPDERQQSAVAFTRRAGPTTAQPIKASPSATFSPNRASATSGPDPMPRAPTAKPGASSKPACANGLTLNPS